MCKTYNQLLQCVSWLKQFCGDEICSEDGIAISLMKGAYLSNINKNLKRLLKLRVK